MDPQPRPRYLLIETSGGSGSVGLAQGEQLLSEQRLDEARRHARDLAPAVRRLLDEQSWKPADVQAVLASIGPGSYTGLRVGLMSAKAFAYAAGCAFLGVETLPVIALHSGRRLVEVIADAQQGKVYAQRFAVEPGTPIPRALTALTVLPFTEWTAQLPADAWATGPGVTAYEAILPAALPKVEAKLRAPQLASLLRIGNDRYARGERDDFWAAEPVYQRPSSAEEKWNASGRTPASVPSMG